MQELAELVAVLVGLHVALGLHWFPRAAYVFRALVGARPRAFAASVAWGSDRMALFFGPPLPWTGRFHLVELFPVSLARDAVAASPACDPNPGGRTPRGERVTTWDEARRARAEGRNVYLGRERFVATGSDALARHVARTLTRLGALDEDERARAIDALSARSLDESLVRERVEAWRREARILRLPATATFAFLFAALPAIGFALGLAMTWIWLLAAILALQAWSAIAFFRAHRRLHPDERGERARATFTVALSPLEALRTSEILARDLLAEFHPFAVAFVTLERADFEPFAERVLRDASHPMPAPDVGVDARYAAAEDAWRASLVRALTDAAARAGLRADLASSAPRGDADERTYCPRCTRKYVLESGTCAECWELPLARSR